MIAVLVGAVVLMQIVSLDDFRHGAVLTNRASLLPEKLLSEGRPMRPTKNVFINYITPNMERLFSSRFSRQNVTVWDSCFNRRLHLHALPLWNEATPFSRAWNIKPKVRRQFIGKNSALDAPADVSSRCASRVHEAGARLKPQPRILIERVSDKNGEIGAQLGFAKNLLPRGHLFGDRDTLNNLFGIDSHGIGNPFHSGGSSPSFGNRFLHFSRLVGTGGFGISAQADSGPPEEIRRYKQQCGDKGQYARKSRYGVIRCPYPKGFVGWLLLRACGLGLLIALVLFGPAMWLDRKRSR